MAFGLLLVGALAIVGCSNTEEGTDRIDEEATEEIELESDWEAHYTTGINQELIDDHSNRYEEILEDFHNSDYTFENPLIIQDPYDRAPLTALVLFETDNPLEITVTVEGQTEETTISHTYTGFETKHEIPVLGLYPDFENNVTLTGRTETGEIIEEEFVMITDTLPDNMLDFTLVTSHPEMMQEGLTFLSPSNSNPSGIDSNGDVRWYSSARSSNNFKRIENGHLLMATQEEGAEDFNHITETDMLGRVYQSIFIDLDNIVYSSPLHHDIIILPNDNYLALTHDGSEEYIEDEVVELDRETGEVVHRINLKDVFPREMYEEYEGHQDEYGDWAHVNALWKLQDEEAILLSVRQHDMIIKLTYPEGEIDWVFSYPEDREDGLEEYLLESVDENLKYPAGQHAVLEMPDQDGNEDTLDIMLFDNNRIFKYGDEDLDTEYSRGVHYRINQEENTVEEIWSYGEERGTELYTNVVSNAAYFPETENVLMNFGRTLNEEAQERYSVITEVTKTDNPEVVYELHYGPYDADAWRQIYRAERFSLYPKN